LASYWLVVGSTKNWSTAFEHGNIWGLKETQRQLWERINENDLLLFYATQPVSGIIGHGIVRTKFKQSRPLWPQEINERRVIWPLRFEFDVVSLQVPDKWLSTKVTSKLLNPRSGFQMLSSKVGRELVNSLGTSEYIVQRTSASSIAETSSLLAPSQEKIAKGITSHNLVKKALVQIGRLQSFIAEEEYPFDIGKLDVVWRRVELSVPTYVFEVNVGGDVYHALGKLKHAFDLWNSHIFIVASEADQKKVDQLVSGTFHEIGPRLKFIELAQVDELYERKKAYRDFERGLGIF
jgi:predicted RNA-binding protein